jgi:hypothetical protein
VLLLPAASLHAVQPCLQLLAERWQLQLWPLLLLLLLPQGKLAGH